MKTQTTNITLTTTSHVKSLITKRTRYMPMEMQTLNWGMEKKIAGLNQLIAYQIYQWVNSKQVARCKKMLSV